MEEDKMLPKKIIVYRDIEPSVICNELLHRLIREQGHKGEAARLSRDIPIDYKNITKLRIEFQNILLIDHLWMLPNLQKLSLKCNKIDRIENLDLLINLRELDLSFNFIAKIENLECLTQLQFLSLFGNNIKRIENLDALVNLVRLSLGNNRIESLDGIERLRFMKKLYSFNMEGNPAVTNFRRDVSFCGYIAAFLPTLKYYNYKFLGDAEREQACEVFRTELRSLEEAEEVETEQINKTSKEKEDDTCLSTCFVEFLNEYQFFESLFAGDDNAKILLAIEGADVLLKEYRNQIYGVTQKICKLGIERHESRSQSIQEFNEALKIGVKEVQSQAVKIVDDFINAKEVNLEKLKNVFVSLNEESIDTAIDSTDLEERLNESEVLENEFISKLDESWYALMDLETTLHERIDEANKSFGHTIQDSLYTFIENAQLHFVQISEAETEFSERLHELVSNDSVNKTSKCEANDSNERIIEKDEISNLIATSRDFRLQVIDRREERLVSRSRLWVADLIAKHISNEHERNRRKLLEIDEFIQNSRTSYHDIKDNLISGADLTRYF